MLSMAKGSEEVERQLSNMARAARKVGPNDRVVELRKVCVFIRFVRLVRVACRFGCGTCGACSRRGK